MLKFIHSDFELNLDNEQVTILDENQWFTDDFVVKLTFPIEQELSAQLDKALGMVSDYNSVNTNLILSGSMIIEDQIHDATMELEELQETARFVFRIGFEELPNFGTKLAALPLFNQDLNTAGGETIRTHAAAQLQSSQITPDYNFPQIHLTSIDTDSDQWAFFEGRLNAQAQGAFLENEYDAVEDAQQNRNIMQPLPSLHHVIKTAFTSLGFTVGGDFFEDPAFAKAYIFHSSKFYQSFQGENELIEVRYNDPNVPSPNRRMSVGFVTIEADFVTYTKDSSVLNNGVYLINGVLSSYGPFEWRILFNNTVVWRKSADVQDLLNPFFKNHYVDVTVDVTPDTGDVITFECRTLPYSVDPLGNRDFETLIADITLSQIAKTDAEGNLISTLIDPTRIDLRQCVPDVTFRDLMTEIKKYVGIDILKTGPSEYRIDLVKNLIDNGQIIDLSEYEVKYPRRRYRVSKKHVLKTPESVEGAYLQEAIIISNSGVAAYNDEEIDEDTTEVNVNLTMLNLKNKVVNTAIEASTDDTAINLVFFDHNNNQDAVTSQWPLSLQDSYNQNLKPIYDHMISGVPFQWTFEADRVKVQQLKTRSRVFAYNRIHVVEKIQRTYLSREKVQVRLDLLSV